MYFDFAGRLIRQVTDDPDGEDGPLRGKGRHSTVSDLAGRQTAFVDELGRRTEYAYNAIAGWLETIHLPDPETVGQTDGTITYVRSARGEVLTMTNAEGESVELLYDFAGRLIRQIADDPDGEIGPLGRPIINKHQPLECWQSLSAMTLRLRRQPDRILQTGHAALQLPIGNLPLLLLRVNLADERVHLRQHGVELLVQRVLDIGYTFVSGHQPLRGWGTPTVTRNAGTKVAPP